MYAGRRARVWLDNHASAYLHANEIDEQIASHLANGWMLDVTALYVADHMLPIIVSPMAVAPKPNGKFRLIFDASSTLGRCPNDFIDSSAFATPSLATCDSVRSAILEAAAARPGERVLLWTSDFSNAYKAIPLRVDDWWQMGQLWRGRVYWNIACPFGLRSSDRHLHTLTSAIAPSVLRASSLLPQFYVDDGILVGHDDSVPAASRSLVSISASVGLSLSSAKDSPPDTHKKYIGWLWDTAAMTMSLPPGKLASIRATISDIAASDTVSRSDLTSVLQAMQHAQGGIRHARAFMSELFGLLRGARYGRITLTPLARVDLAFWRDLLDTFNGTTLLRHPSASLTTFSDASNTGWLGNGGYGWVCDDLRIYGHGPWPDEFAGSHINGLESLAALICLHAVAGRVPSDTAVSVLTRLDSTTAVSVVTNRRGSPGFNARIARALAFLCASHPALHPLSSHVKGVDNPVADGLSRNKPLPPELASYTEVHTPAAWLVSTLQSERPWMQLAPPRATSSAAAPGPPSATPTPSPPSPSTSQRPSGASVPSSCT